MLWLHGDSDGDVGKSADAEPLPRWAQTCVRCTPVHPTGPAHPSGPKGPGAASPEAHLPAKSTPGPAGGKGREGRKHHALWKAHIAAFSPPRRPSVGSVPCGV
jgi:hypothetical protein